MYETRPDGVLVVCLQPTRLNTLCLQHEILHTRGVANSVGVGESFVGS